MPAEPTDEQKAKAALELWKEQEHVTMADAAYAYDIDPRLVVDEFERQDPEAARRVEKTLRRVSYLLKARNALTRFLGFLGR